MTAQPTVGPSGYTGDTLTGLTADIVHKIDGGMVDGALRVIFDAVVDRKKVLDASGTLPHQITRQDVDNALLVTPTWSDPNPAAASSQDNGQYWSGNSPIATPATLTLDPPKKAVRRRKVEPRPDPSTPVFTGQIVSLVQSQTVTYDPKNLIVIDGFPYDKREIIGKHVHLTFPGHPGLTFKITGVGPKTLKALVVNEPQMGTRLQGKDVWKAWDTNTPMFLPHSAIAHWLVKHTH